MYEDKYTKTHLESELGKSGLKNILELAAEQSVDLNYFFRVDDTEYVGDPILGPVIVANRLFARMAKEEEIVKIRKLRR
jgi:hypothetical protein